MRYIHYLLCRIEGFCTLQNLFLLCFIFIAALIFLAALFSQLDVRSVQGEFKFIVKRVVFTLDEPWKPGVTFNGRTILEKKSSICDSNFDYESDNISTLRIINELPTDTKVILSSNNGIRLETYNADEKYCEKYDIRANVNDGIVKKKQIMRLGNEFVLDVLPPNSHTKDCVVQQDSAACTNEKYYDFYPVLVRALSFVDEKSVRTNISKRKSELLVLESGDLVSGEITLPHYNDKKISIGVGQSLYFDIKRAHILNLTYLPKWQLDDIHEFSITQRGNYFELSGVAEFNRLEKPDYSYLENNSTAYRDADGVRVFKEADLRGVSVMPTFLEHVLVSQWFGILSGLFALFFTVIGAFELYALRTGLTGEDTK